VGGHRVAGGGDVRGHGADGEHAILVPGSGEQRVRVVGVFVDVDGDDGPGSTRDDDGYAGVGDAGDGGVVGGDRRDVLRGRAVDERDNVDAVGDDDFHVAL
jgi:hypothetical protein